MRRVPATKTGAIDFRLWPDVARADTLSPCLEIDRGGRFSIKYDRARAPA